MRTINRFVFLFLSFALPAIALSQSSPITLDRLVSSERQRVLGLDKLTPEQRAGVARLLQEAYELGLQKAQGQADSPRTASPPARAAATPAVIETQIDGEFNGWEGETIFKLLNGQIWQQSEYHYHYHYAYMPKVLLYRSGGGYKLKVEGVEKAVGVERLR